MHSTTARWRAIAVAYLSTRLEDENGRPKRLVVDLLDKRGYWAHSQQLERLGNLARQHVPTSPCCRMVLPGSKRPGGILTSLPATRHTRTC